MSIDLLKRFSASSYNDTNYKHLWVKGASLFIEQLDTLLKQVDYKMNLVPIENFKNSFQEELGSVLNTNRSDKASYHNYNIIYSFILNELGRNNSINVCEIGMGTNNDNLISTMGSEGRPGASLYSWRDYLPNANIYGADIDSDILFESERIKTSFVDQLEYNTLIDMKKNFGNVTFDLFIDDGLHSIGANFNCLLFGLENINVGGWIVIEDIGQIDNWNAIDYILSNSTKWKTYAVKTSTHHMYVVKRLN